MAESPPSEDTSLPTSVTGDRWLLGALAVLLLAYGVLAVLKPSGEGFGRGWNMIAFFLYGAPTAFAAGLVAWWRHARVRGPARRAAAWGAAAGLLFPALALLVMRLRA